MAQESRDLSAVEIERRLLAALCDPALADSSRSEILGRLDGHEFANPDHEVIFRALAKVPRAGLRHTRETLGAHLTRLGFPDIDVAPIFALEALSAQDVAALLGQLRR